MFVLNYYYYHYKELGALVCFIVLIIAKMQLIVCDTEDKVTSLVRWGRYRLPLVTTIVHMNSVSRSTVKACSEENWRILSFSDMEVC